MPFYTSPEQLMRERSELARKGIARGRSVVVLTCAEGVLFVAENTQKSLHKVSEIYDRIGFAAVGRYNEYENLRVGGIRIADLRGYSNDRRDVTGRSLAHAYAQTLGTIFTDQLKPYEVEICVAEVGATRGDDVLYRITYDGSIVDEPDFVVMGGSTEPISNAMKASYHADLSISDGLAAAVAALRSAPAPGGTGSAANADPNGRELGIKQLEVAILDRRRPRRAFRRIVGAALAALLPGAEAKDAEQVEEPVATSATGTTAATSEDAPANPPTGDASGDATRESGAE